MNIGDFPVAVGDRLNLPCLNASLGQMQPPKNPDSWDCGFFNCWNFSRIQVESIVTERQQQIWTVFIPDFYCRSTNITKHSADGDVAFSLSFGFEQAYLKSITKTVKGVKAGETLLFVHNVKALCYVREKPGKYEPQTPTTVYTDSTHARLRAAARRFYTPRRTEGLAADDQRLSVQRGDLQGSGASATRGLPTRSPSCC